MSQVRRTVLILLSVIGVLIMALIGVTGLQLKKDQNPEGDTQYAANILNKEIREARE
ncbi:hypothetical protein GCM10007049_20970 [Echinicola pacifica]|uniref:Uncharacterized protein n=1 Tax=Echinicola pacifica TaxID=346377 RepID=A0A918Q1B6_9BACT|nr:hypothetical protein [Echinicola pacifica]GGZ27910.1 hypothetical protein GCM10007049_20970 [Echinicola pacifica]